MKNGGFSLVTVAFLILATLKLAEVGVVATWSWWWVTAPLWGGALFSIAMLLVVGFFALVGAILTALVNKGKPKQAGPARVLNRATMDNRRDLR